jgi:ribosome biogenesis protein ENP2
MVTRVGAQTAIYCLSDGARLPAWAEQSDQARRKALKRDERLGRRVELLQGLEFDGGASRRIKFSDNGQMLVVTGEYPPACKVFELSQLGQKYERRLGCASVDVWPLSPDLGKMVFLLADRTLDFHAPYGTHYKIRVPSAGRRLLYDKANCVLHVASGQKAAAHRLDLDSGTFLADLETGAPSSCCDLAKGVPLTAFGCEDGIVRFFDARTSSTAPVALLDVGNDVTALKFDGEGLNVACGTSDAEVKLYDLRSKKPTLVKAHQNLLPIVDLKWHSSSKETAAHLVLSSDARVLKAWDSRSGKVFTNVEPSAPLNHVAVAPASDGCDSGLILMAGEQSRVMAYYVPALGRAPRWCAFLDSLTEELEEKTQSHFEDYRFVSKTELEDLGGEAFIGTPQLRAHAHGFFMDARLFKRLRAAAAPYAYDDYKKQKVAKALQAKQESRIRRAEALPAVNAALAQRLLDPQEPAADKPRQRGKKKKKLVQPDATSANPLGDDRFSSMFTDTSFQVDDQTAEYRLRHPPVHKKKKEPSSGNFTKK